MERGEEGTVDTFSKPQNIYRTAYQIFASIEMDDGVG